jgi:hypothetical protein
MGGETDLSILLRTMRPVLNEGEFVFCSVPLDTSFDKEELIGSFREAEGLTVILKKNTADTMKLKYTFVASWITLTVHSSLEAVGLTAVFSNVLADAGISCNVIAGYYHDHIFISQKDASSAVRVLESLRERD